MKRSGILAGFLFVLLAGAAAPPAMAQGIIAGPDQPPDLADAGLGELVELKPQEVATIQRLLKRLGYLKEGSLTRTMDAETAAAISAHVAEAKLRVSGLTAERLIRSLFSMAWTKEGWASGNVDGQDIIVDKAEVRLAQDSLKKLGLAPGPVDGVYGPATLTATEIFQEDNGLKVNGLLTRNTFHNITRAVKFVDNPPLSTIRMLNWPDYIDPAALDGFERETNIRVVHETFEESAETKELLLQGSDKYDVMVQPGAQMRQVVEKDGAVLKLDLQKIPNSKGLDPTSQNYVEALDPGNAHSVPYMWGTVGLGVNREMVKQIRPDAPINSMALLLDPKYAAELSKCGLAVIDEPIDVIPAIVSYLGGDFNSLGIADLEQVDAALSKVASYVQVVSIDSYIDDLTNGKYCVAFGYSGDILFAREPAKERKTGTLVYSVPKEGSEIWFDLLVIPGNAKNKDGAYKLINYLLKPQVAAASTNYLQYANAVRESAPFIDPKLLKDPGLYPPRKTLEGLAIQPPLSQEVEVELKRIWAKFKNK